MNGSKVKPLRPLKWHILHNQQFIEFTTLKTIAGLLETEHISHLVKYSPDLQWTDVDP